MVSEVERRPRHHPEDCPIIGEPFRMPERMSRLEAQVEAEFKELRGLVQREVLGRLDKINGSVAALHAWRNQHELNHSVEEAEAQGRQAQRAADLALLSRVWRLVTTDWGKVFVVGAIIVAAAKLL